MRGDVKHSLHPKFTELDILNRMLRDFAISIIRTLRGHGYQAYLVGGCVRDLLLKREPADYDVATDATPDEVMRIFPKTYAVGVQFGVVLVAAGENASWKSLPSASDVGYSDGRHPDEVQFTKSPRKMFCAVTSPSTD